MRRGRQSERESQKVICDVKEAQIIRNEQEQYGKRIFNLLWCIDGCYGRRSHRYEMHLCFNWK